MLDEPLSNLDAKLRVEMRDELVKLHRDLKTTIIYVTHDQTEALTMSTKIAVFFDGELMQVDTPKNLYRYPRNMKIRVHGKYKFHRSSLQRGTWAPKYNLGAWKFKYTINPKA